MDCRSCEGIVRYADDSSCSISSSSHAELPVKVGKIFNSVADFITANLLNVETNTMILTTSQLRQSWDLDVQVQISETLQATSRVETLLGLHLDHNFKFTEHILNTYWTHTEQWQISGLRSQCKVKGTATDQEGFMLQDLTYACQWVIHVQALLPHLCLGWMPRISPFKWFRMSLWGQCTREKKASNSRLA